MDHCANADPSAAAYIALFVVAPIAILFSTWVLVTGWRRRLHRNLALLFMLEGLAFVGGPIVEFICQSDANAWFRLYERSIGPAALFALEMLPAAYVGLIGAAIKHPITRPFQGRWTTPIALAVWAPVPVLVLVLESAAFEVAALIALTLVQVYGLVAAIMQFRATGHGTLERRQAGTYLAAFGTRDIAWPVLLLIPAIMSYAGVDVPRFVNLAAALLITEVFVLALLVFGALRTSVLGLEFRVKRSVAKAIVATIFVIVGYGASEAAEKLIELRTGSEWIGVGAAGLLVFAIKPLLSFGSALAARMMPGTKEMDEVTPDRAKEAYGQQVTIAAADGGIRGKERAMLDSFRDQLGLSKRAAAGIEKERLAQQT